MRATASFALCSSTLPQCSENKRRATALTGSRRAPYAGRRKQARPAARPGCSPGAPTHTTSHKSHHVARHAGCHKNFLLHRPKITRRSGHTGSASSPPQPPPSASVPSVVDDLFSALEQGRSCAPSQGWAQKRVLCDSLLVEALPPARSPPSTALQPRWGRS